MASVCLVWHLTRTPPFLPGGAVYEKMVDREDPEPAFGASDLYAAYRIKTSADKIGFGRNANPPSRRQSRFLFYFIVIRLLHNIILLTPELLQPDVSPSAITKAVNKLGSSSNKNQFKILCDAAARFIDEYLTFGSANSAHNEKAFIETHNGDLNAFLKAENLGTEGHSPLLVQLLAIHNTALGHSISDDPSPRELIAQALLN